MMPAAHIGPNAVTRLAEALPADAARAVFGAAGVPGYLCTPPHDPVPEVHVQALHRALHACLGPARADAAAREAGRRTAQYLLAHRIPRAFQVLLRVLPWRAAAVLLLVAIGRHACTFAGSGRFERRAGEPLRWAIVDNPLCRDVWAASPRDAYFAAVFEHLFRVLVTADARVHEVACAACGAPACVFELRRGG